MQIGWKFPVGREVEKMSIAPRSRTGTSLGASDNSTQMSSDRGQYLYRHPGPDIFKSLI